MGRYLSAPRLPPIDYGATCARAQTKESVCSARTISDLFAAHRHKNLCKRALYSPNNIRSVCSARTIPDLIAAHRQKNLCKRALYSPNNTRSVCSARTKKKKKKKKSTCVDTTA